MSTPRPLSQASPAQTQFYQPPQQQAASPQYQGQLNQLQQSQPQQRGAPQPLPSMSNQQQNNSPMQLPHTLTPTTSTNPQNASFYQPPLQRTPHAPYNPPTTPTGHTHERTRIALLIRLNTLLLSHASSLQSKNLGGVLPTPPSAVPDPVASNKAPSPEYIAYLRAIQANIAFCAMVEQRGKRSGGGPTLPGPAIVEAPAGASGEIEECYEKVRELWPGWRGVVGNRGAAVMGSGGVAGGAGAGGSMSGSASQQQTQTPQHNAQILGLTQQAAFGGQSYPGQVPTPGAGAMPSMNAPQMAFQQAQQQQQQQVQQQQVSDNAQG